MPGLAAPLYAGGSTVLQGWAISCLLDYVLLASTDRGTTGRRYGRYGTGGRRDSGRAGRVSRRASAAQEGDDEHVEYGPRQRYHQEHGQPDIQVQPEVHGAC